uniref:Kynureninase n=1 Tax=Caulobacter sp. (strain K31) TaxID=366602 RepID=B0T9J0_CAUSK
MDAFNRQIARDLDAQDPLALHRDKFHLPSGLVYLDGNSLGCLPFSAQRRVEEAVTREWGDTLIGAWLNADWLTLATRVGDRIARLVGADPGEVVAADSTSINLYKALHAALGLRPSRTRILAQAGDFPTDLYIIDSVATATDRKVSRLKAEDILAAIDEDVAVIVLTHVNYKTAAVHDMAAITAAAHAKGALVVWDLAHTAGAVPCALNVAGADFAVGCGYKYLNGGPGAPAFLFVAKRHQPEARQPLTGWFGHRAPFEFSDTFEAAPGAERFLCGTPPILALSALDGALDAFDGIEIEALAAKSRTMTEGFVRLFDAELAPLGFVLHCERNPDRRGSHVAFSHPDGYAIMRALADRGFVGDFRAPDVLRFGFAPLYNRYVEVEGLVSAIVEIMLDRSWDRPAYRVRQAMT